MTEKLEYRVRPVTRYIVTRYEEGIAHAPGVPSGPKSTEHGTYDNEATAYDVATALAFKEREDLGWPPGDERMQFAQRAPA